MRATHRFEKKRKSRAPLILILCLLFAAAGIFAAYWYLTADERLYRQGLELLDAGDYQGAIEIFEALPDHEQAPARIPKAKYGIASELMAEERYLEAAEAFGQLEDYQDSPQQVLVCYYQLATSERLAGNYESARSYFALAGDYHDAALQVQRMTYSLGHTAFLEGNYESAREFFAQLEGSQTDYGYLHFETLADAAEYLDQQRLELAETIRFHIDAASDPEFYDTLRNLFPCQTYYPNYYGPDKLLTIAGIHYYPGENILYALRSEDTSRLTEEETQVLELAQQVLAQAEEETDTPQALELWLHDWLCNQVTYESPNMDVRREDFIQLRELTCVGAMLDGIANCQGYTDAFYLLGTMAGFEVDRVLGIAGEGHIWNTIRLEDQWYIVDVTFDDLSDKDLSGWSYTYYNTFWDTEVYDPFGSNEASIPVVTEQDLSQSYFTQTNRTFQTVKEAAQSLADQYIKSKSDWSYAMLEGKQITHDDLDPVLKQYLRKFDRSFSWTQWLDSYGGNTYIMIYWE